MVSWLVLVLMHKLAAVRAFGFGVDRTSELEACTWCRRFTGTILYGPTDPRKMFFLKKNVWFHLLSVHSPHCQGGVCGQALLIQRPR